MKKAQSKNKVLRPARHQHQKCLESAIAVAKKHCDSLGLRLTSLRQRVLELVWQDHKSVKAYDILDKLKNGHNSSAPMTVYRVLDFLQEQGLVHKIESLNAYVGCGNPNKVHNGQFLLCYQCNTVIELDDADISEVLKKKVTQIGFEVQNEIIEIKGRCRSCIDIDGS